MTTTRSRHRHACLLATLLLATLLSWLGLGPQTQPSTTAAGEAGVDIEPHG